MNESNMSPNTCKTPDGSYSPAVEQERRSRLRLAIVILCTFLALVASATATLLILKNRKQSQQAEVILNSLQTFSDNSGTFSLKVTDKLSGDSAILYVAKEISSNGELEISGRALMETEEGRILYVLEGGHVAVATTDETSGSNGTAECLSGQDAMPVHQVIRGGRHHRGPLPSTSPYSSSYHTFPHCADLRCIEGLFHY